MVPAVVVSPTWGLGTVAWVVWATQVSILPPQAIIAARSFGEFCWDMGTSLKVLL